jgi:hypothetical protein
VVPHQDGDFRRPQEDEEETTMNRNTMLAIAIGLFAGMAMGAAAPRLPSAEAPFVSPTYGGPAGYLPDQFVIRAKEVEFGPEMYY